MTVMKTLPPLVQTDADWDKIVQAQHEKIETMLAALRTVIRSRHLSIDYDRNRTPEALAIRKVVIAAIENGERP